MALETFDYPDGTDISSLGFTVWGGDFAVAGNELAVTSSTSNSRAVVSSQPNGVISADFTVSSASFSNYGLVFRGVDSDNFLEVIIASQNGGMRIFEYVGGNGTAIFDQISSSRSLSGSFNLRVEFLGKDIAILVNGSVAARVESDKHLAGTLAGIRLDNTTYSADNFNYQTKTIPTPVAPPTYIQSGFARSANKIGKIADIHGEIVAAGGSEEFWPFAVETSNIPNWPSAKYPVILYSSTDHSAGSGGIFLRVYNSELGDITSPSSWEEWQDVSNRTEFDHIATKTCPIYLDPSEPQTETPTVIVDGGNVRMLYHTASTTEPDYGPAVQNTHIATSTNGVDFTLLERSVLTYNPKLEQGAGHTGYAQVSPNNVPSIPYTWLCCSAHGGGSANAASVQAYWGSNDLINWEKIKLNGRELGDLILDAPDAGAFMTYNLQTAKMTPDGRFFRTVMNFRKDVVDGGDDAPYYVTELLVDEDFKKVSKANYFIDFAEADSFDEDEMQHYSEVEYNGTTYAFYKAASSSGVYSIGMAEINEVPYDWEIQRPYSDKNVLSSVGHANTSMAVASNTTLSNNDDTLNMTLPANGDYASVSLPSLVLDDYDVVDLVIKRHGKVTYEDISGLVGFFSSGDTESINLRLPEAADATVYMTLNVEEVGVSYSDVTRKAIGMNNLGGRSDGYDDASAKQNYGIRIFPSERIAYVTDANSMTTRHELWGLDTSQPMTPRLSMYTNEGVAANSEFESIEVITYSNNLNSEIDTTPPVVTNDGPSTLTLTVGDTYTPDFTALDDNDGVLPVTVSDTVDTSTAGTYTVTATATDAAGNVGSATQTVVVEEVPVNQPPTANAGPDQSVAAGERVQLNASMSSDPEDGAISQFGWEQVDNGADPVVLEFANTATPEFTAPSSLTPQTLEFRVQAQDSEGAASTDTVLVTVAALQENEILSTMETLDFELVTQGNLVAYKGRSNREVMQLKPSSVAGIVTAGGYLDLTQNGIAKVEVIADGKKISNENSDSIKINGSKILARLGDLDIPTAGRDSIQPTFMIVLYVGSDTRGLVVASNATSGYKPLSYRVEDAA